MQAKLCAEAQAYNKYYEDPRESPERLYEGIPVEYLSGWDQDRNREELEACIAHNEAIQAGREKRLEEIKSRVREMVEAKEEVERTYRDVLDEQGEGGEGV